MTQTVITITLRGAAAEKMRNASIKQPTNEPQRIDWTGYSRFLADEHK